MVKVNKEIYCATQLLTQRHIDLAPRLLVDCNYIVAVQIRLCQSASLPAPALP